MFHRNVISPAEVGETDTDRPNRFFKIMILKNALGIAVTQLLLRFCDESPELKPIAFSKTSAPPRFKTLSCAFCGYPSFNLLTRAGARIPKALQQAPQNPPP